ncbi:MAG: cob(I)yrinic acid a,c-diamide adenosyltransferase [Deltaproteobacteria bacterium]|nr:cob(I)yrinic acid a,c-diamide adenosyltransferase [Deltaproteobacteria bacterium]
MADRKGLVHVYTGDGKGKTTAAIGLASRAAGSGMKVLFVQFFKPESDASGEKEVFKGIANIEHVRSNERHAFFTGANTDTEKVRASVRKTFEAAVLKAGGGFDMLILDEALAAINAGFITEADVLGFLKGRPAHLEVVLTGRDAPVWLVKAADYVTEMLMIRHPFSVGEKARKGIEY